MLWVYLSKFCGIDNQYNSRFKNSLALFGMHFRYYKNKEKYKYLLTCFHFPLSIRTRSYIKKVFFTQNYIIFERNKNNKIPRLADGSTYILMSLLIFFQTWLLSLVVGNQTKCFVVQKYHQGK